MCTPTVPGSTTRDANAHRNDALSIAHYRIDESGFSPELFANGAVDTVANLTRDVDGWHSTPPAWYFQRPKGLSIYVPSANVHTVVSYDIVRVRIPLSYFYTRINSGKVDAFGARCTLVVPETVVDLAKSISTTLRDAPTNVVNVPDMMLVESVGRAMEHVWVGHRADYSDTLPSTMRHGAALPTDAAPTTGYVQQHGPSPGAHQPSASYVPPAVDETATTTTSTSTTTTTLNMNDDTIKT